MSLLLPLRTMLITGCIALAGHAAFPQGASMPAGRAIVPAERLSESWWAERHAAILVSVRAHPDTQLLMIGDSITNNYDKATPPDENFQPTWNTFYAPRKALNLGFSGDTTANVLWRLNHGEVEGLHPKVAVLLIGTNNTGLQNQSAEETESGIDAVIGELEQRLPQAHILLLGILPSAVSASKTRRDQAVNQYLARCYGENSRISYLDVASIFFKAGVLNTQIFYDPRLPQHGSPLHPDTTGQRLMAEAIEPTLAEWMEDFPRVPLISMTDINTALIPVPHLEQDSYDWYARHHAELDVQRTLNPRVVMMGDSVTHFWAGSPAGIQRNGPQSWASLFGATPVLNMGFGWDRTQNVLWRLRQGEFDELHPAWIVLMIGTNNLTGTMHARANTPKEIVAAIAEICNELNQHSPSSRIVLMAILPRGALAISPLRLPIQQTNQLLAQRFAADPAVTYIDIGASFLAPDGSLALRLMPDGTHPSEAGYQLWADALMAAGVGK